MRQGLERTNETPPILQFVGVEQEGDVEVGKFVFNGPGLLRHARENEFELSPKIIEILEKVNWEINADLEGRSSLDDLDGDFIKNLAELAEEDLTEEKSWQ